MHTDATNLCLLLDNFWFRYNLIRTRCLLFYQAKNRRLEIKIFVKIFYSQLIKICYEIFMKKIRLFGDDDSDRVGFFGRKRQSQRAAAPA